MSLKKSLYSFVYLSETHCHENKAKPDLDRKARRKLVIACILSLCFMIAEVLGRFPLYDLDDKWLLKRH